MPVICPTCQIVLPPVDRTRFSAHRLFRRLDARIDLVYVGGKVSELETTYFDVVREWGQSIESADSYTFGHCERVAQSALGEGPLSLFKTGFYGAFTRTYYPASVIAPINQLWAAHADGKVHSKRLQLHRHRPGRLIDIEDHPGADPVRSLDDRRRIFDKRALEQHQ